MTRFYHHEEKRDIGPLERAYGRFLEPPPAVVVSVLWLAGLTLVGACVPGFYLYVPLLVGV